MVLLLVGLGLVLILLFYVVLRPSVHARKEIYKGVFLTTIEIPSNIGSGLAMVTEIHWDEPGVELYFRPCIRRTDGKGSFVLLPPDYIHFSDGLSVSMNSTRYFPGEWYKSYPLKRVDTVETLVWKGMVSHIHKHSYMFAWDEDWNFRHESTKPPSRNFLETVRYGIGVQGVNVSGGLVQYNTFANSSRDARSFLGVDPERKVMWLMVFDNISEKGMSELAQQQGVIVGGQLDLGDAATMIVGFGAQGITPYTGIRGRRPLAGMIGVKAQSLD